jgi:hypothetical protein
MNRAQRRASKKLPRLGMCLNCGQIKPTPGRPPHIAMICSFECEHQWNDLCDRLDDDEGLHEIGLFVARWPDVSTDEFKHIVTISQHMDTKYPGVWPFAIEYHSDKGCWHYARKGAVHLH